LPQKDLGMMAMNYGNVYVAKVALGANDNQTVKAFVEAEAYDGPSLIIAYCHCIAHGINMTAGSDQQKAAVDSGAWTLYRFNPNALARGLNPLTLDSKEPSIPVKDWMYRENRFNMLTLANPQEAERLLNLAQYDVRYRWHLYEQMSKMDYSFLEEGR